MKQQEHFLFFRKIFLTGCLFLISLMGWGQTYNYTFIASVFTSGTNPETKTLNSNDWTLSTNPIGANFRGYDSTKGLQFGSGTTPATTATLSTSAISGTITSVKISTSGAASIVGTVAVSVGGNNYGTSNSISSTNTLYTFNGTSSGQIIISWSQSSSKAFYIKNIEITYASTPTVTFDKNAVDATGTMTNQIASTATNLTSNSFARVGYAFSNWNTLANGNGTSYANNASFPFSANATLYAQWTAITPPTATAATIEGSSSFTANWNAVSGATSYEIDVFTIQTTSNSNVASWTFPLSGTTVTPDSGSSSNNSAKILSTNLAIINDLTGNTSRAASATNWTNGNGSKYWQIEINSIGFENLKLSSKQRSSGTGPRDFKIQYNVGSGWVDVSDSNITVADNFTTGVKTNLTLPSDCNNKTNLLIRWIMTSNTSVENGVVGNSGTSRIDDIIITGVLLSTTFVTGYNALNTGNFTSYLISGLTPNTTYYYNVRTVNGSASANSNTITANTINDIATADFRSLTNGDFSTASSWQFNAGTVSGWINATQAPTSANNITIQSPHIITLSQNVSVNASKTLAIASGGTLTVGTGKILTISGTLNNNGSIIFKSDADGTAVFGQFSGIITGSGTATVERYIPAKRAWRLLTAPLKGTSSNTVSSNWQGVNGEGMLLFSPATYQGTTMMGYTTGGGLPNIWNYSNGWVKIPNITSETMFNTSNEETKAYLVFATGPHGSTNIVTGQADTTLKSTGQLISGDVSHTLIANQFKLIANPYACPLNTVALRASNSGSKIWMVDPSLGTVGGYYVYDGTSWAPTTPTVSGNDAYIQSGQGFFVRNTSDATFTISESHKVIGNSNTWFAKTANTETTESADKIRILLHKKQGTDWKLADGILAINYASGNNALDATDTQKMSNFNENIMFKNGTTNLSMEYSALPQVGHVQPMYLTGTTSQPYQLQLFTEGYSNATVSPFLQDTTTGTFTAIPTDGTILSVPFTGIATTSTSPDQRFKIVYQSALNSDDFTSTFVLVYPNPVTNNLVNIQLKSISENTEFTLTNLLGQIVHQGKLNAIQNAITLPKVQEGMYMITVKQEGKKFTTKLYIQ